MYSAASTARRREFATTLAIMVVGAFAELMTIGAVLPFLAIIATPDRAFRSPLLTRIVGLFGPWGYEHVILLLALVVISASVFAAGVRLLLSWTSLRFVVLYGHDLGSRIYARMLRQPYSHYLSRNTSEYLAGIEKLQAVVFGVLLPVMQGITSAVIAAAIIVLLFRIDAFTATVAAASMLSTYALVIFVTRIRLRTVSTEWAEAAEGRVKTIQEGLGGLRDILLDHSQSVFEATFRRFDLRYRKAQAVTNFIATAPRFVVESAGIVLIAILAVILVGRPGGVVGAIPVLGALALGSQRLLPLLQSAYNGWSAYQGNHQMLLDVAALLEAPIMPEVYRDTSRPPRPFRREVVFDRVGFSYSERGKALHDASFSLRKGERLGIVGKTGSGKSTLMDLLMGLLVPTSGQITIDGRPLAGETLIDWQTQVAHVPQAIYLSDNTIASNIAFSETVAALDFERVREAARRAEIDDFIMSLPEGYDTMVGERGIRLSGGQRQRIGIARALYKGAKVLVFDEATSALDDETEVAVMRSIERIGREVTLILIAHRVTTLSICDEVLHLRDGQIIDISSYADLLAGG